MQTRPSLRRSRRVASRDQGRVVNRVRQHGTRSSRHGRTSSSFARSTTSRTSASEIIQSVVNSTSGGPPSERASTAIEEGAAEDDGAPVSFSTPRPFTAARLFRLSNTRITSQLYPEESDTESESSIAVGNDETSASAPRNHHDATQKTSASNGLNHNASSTSTTSQTAPPASTSREPTPGDASTTLTPSQTAPPNSIATVATHGDPSLTSPPSLTAAPASTSANPTPGDASITSTPSLVAAPNSLANVCTHGDPSYTSHQSQTAAHASILGAPTHGDESLTSPASNLAVPADATTITTNSHPNTQPASLTTTSTNAGGMNDLPIDQDVMRAVHQAIAGQGTPQVSNGEDRATSNTSHLGGPIPGSNSHGVVGGTRHLTQGGINHSAMPRRSYSSESSFELSSDSEDSMPVPGAAVRRNIEEIVISDTESQHTSNSLTIGRGMSMETLLPMIDTAIDNVSDLICAEIEWEGNESQMLDPTFNTWPWKPFINPEVGKIAYDYFYKFHCSILRDWLNDPVKLGDHYFSKSGLQGMCDRAREQNKTYFWHPIAHSVEVSINRRFQVDLKYSNLVHKAQELCNKMNFKWVTRVISAKQMLMSNRNMVAGGGRESEGDGTHNQDSNIGNIADGRVVNNETDATGEESSEVILNESELENTLLPSIPEGGILSTSTTTVVASESNNNETSNTSAVGNIPASNTAATATVPMIPLNVGLRKMPTKWDQTEGHNLGYNILSHSQRLGWSTTLAYRNRTSYFRDYSTDSGWFGHGGIFSGYKTYAAKGMQNKFASFEEYVKKKFVRPAHSTDQTGADGEEMPCYAALYLQYLEHVKDNQFTQSAAAMRRRKNEIISTHVEERGPLGSNGNMPPLSQIRSENERFVTTNRNTSTTIVPVGVGNITQSGINHTIASPAAKKAKLDNLKNTPLGNQQLGGFLNNFMKGVNEQIGHLVDNTSEQPATTRTVGDIMRDYTEASTQYGKADETNNETDKAFWDSAKKRLQKELENFGT